MKHKKLLVASIVLAIALAGAVVGAVLWMAVGKKVLLSDASGVDTSNDWSGPVDQPPPPGFSYGEADPKQPPATREQVIARANKFYMDRLGEANFAKYYERLPQRDAFSSLPESAFDFIGYISNLFRR